jgi:hypothetical protein
VTLGEEDQIRRVKGGEAAACADALNCTGKRRSAANRVSVTSVAAGALAIGVASGGTVGITEQQSD